MLHALLAPCAYTAFSSGLRGSMPKSMSSNVLSFLGEGNVSMLPFPCTRQGFDTHCDKLGPDKVQLIAHSSIDVDVLTFHRLSRAILIDPACKPSTTWTGLTQRKVVPRAPVTVLRTAKYSAFVLSPFQPRIVGATVVEADGGGHADVLDFPWYVAADRIGIPCDNKEGRNRLLSFLKKELTLWADSNVVDTITAVDSS